jgi:type I restriction enzyme S subunit
VPVPPLADQAVIVRFLDHADRRIQRAIRAKQKLIALLNEQTQAVIQHAITRGLDPNARLKPSGVDWLGEVPEHWEVKRLKTICRMKSGDGITAERIEAAGTYPVYGGNGLRGYSEDFTHSGEYVLIGRQGALCGNVHVATGKFWASEHAVVASLDARHSVPWFAALLTVMDLNQYSVAAAQPGLAVERILNLGVTVPPPEEQRMIADGIARRTAPLERAARTAEREVNLLREYRTRLIADVVTGKLDVRGAAAGLPVEVGEPEPLDEIDVEQTDESEADDLEAAEA